MSLPSPSVSGSLLPNSAIAEGKVRHRRYQPKSHAFTYGGYLVWLDLEDVGALQQFPLWSGTGPNLVQFRRADYLSPGIPDLRQAVTERLVAAGCSERPHRIKLLTNLRNWGLTFNPVSFYFCFDVQDRPFAVLSEITNTPWDERHTYVHLVPAGEREAAQWEFSFAKCFHVSPFMPMNLDYIWRFYEVPDPKQNRPLVITMEDWTQDATPERIFTATLQVRFKEYSVRHMIVTLLKFPFLTFKAFFAIYFQALLLYLKRVPFFAHPKGVS